MALKRLARFSGISRRTLWSMVSRRKFIVCASASLASKSESASPVRKPSWTRVGPNRSPLRFCSRRARSSCACVSSPAAINFSAKLDLDLVAFISIPGQLRLRSG